MIIWEVGRRDWNRQVDSFLGVIDVHCSGSILLISSIISKLFTCHVFCIGFTPFTPVTMGVKKYRLLPVLRRGFECCGSIRKQCHGHQNRRSPHLPQSQRSKLDTHRRGRGRFINSRKAEAKIGAARSRLPITCLNWDVPLTEMYSIILCH